MTTRGALAVLVVVAGALFAGCFRGGRGRAPEVPPPADSVVVTTPADSGVAPTRPTPGDSARPAAADSARADSTARANADTIPGDSARREPVPVGPPARRARECVLDFTASPPESRLVTTQFGNASRTTFIGGGVVAQCQSDPQVISSDSAEYYEAARLLILRDNVKVEEPGVFTLTAPTVQYFLAEERIVADGGVVVTDVPTGSTLSGPTMEYYRPIPGSRPTRRIFAPNRPVAQLMQTDSAGVPQPPVSITSIYMEERGDGRLQAWGQVEVQRGTILGTSDTASFDQTSERARLLRNATIVSRDTAQPFRLAGDTIDLYSTDRVLERVVARHRAVATQEQLRLAAEVVDLRLTGQRLRQAYAFGAGRATAVTPQQGLEADSIAVQLPNERVEELFAVGDAVATGVPDTLRIRSEERDVLRGDTVIARFDTLASVGDSAGRTVLRDVRAIGSASSLYQIPSSRGPAFPPAINYVTGWRITVAFDTGTVRTVAVDSQASGVYLEPVPDSLARDTVRPPPPDGVRARGSADSLLLSTSSAARGGAFPPLPFLPSRRLRR